MDQGKKTPLIHIARNIAGGFSFFYDSTLLYFTYISPLNAWKNFFTFI